MAKTVKCKHSLPQEAKNIRTTIVGTDIEILFDIEENPKEIKGTQEWLDKYFPIVKASTLSLEDDFLKHEPTSESQKETKKEIISAIKSGLCDFRAQKMDPSMDENGNIYYKVGEKPAVERIIVKEWKKKAKDFLPEKNSRLSENKEHYAFLALLIKYLIEKKHYKVGNAWKAVCDQSKNLGHYIDSKNWKGDFELTGSRKVGKWYDLGNTFKITINEKTGGFVIFGGCYNSYGDDCPLADAISIDYPDNFYNYSVGEIVLDV